MNPITNLEKVECYLRSIENGDFAYIAALFSPNAVLEQLPNRIYPTGIKYGVSSMAAASGSLAAGSFSSSKMEVGYADRVQAPASPLPATFVGYPEG